MKTISSETSEKLALPTGTRDAVETAIDLAKDGKSWERGQDKIRPWKPRLPEDQDACERELVGG